MRGGTSPRNRDDELIKDREPHRAATAVVMTTDPLSGPFGNAERRSWCKRLRADDDRGGLRRLASA
jgi:hypothetical protein